MESEKEILRKLGRESGWTQARQAEFLGVSRQAWNIKLNKGTVKASEFLSLVAVMGYIITFVPIPKEVTTVTPKSSPISEDMREKLNENIRKARMEKAKKKDEEINE